VAEKNKQLWIGKRGNLKMTETTFPHSASNNIENGMSENGHTELKMHFIVEKTHFS